MGKFITTETFNDMQRAFIKVLDSDTQDCSCDTYYLPFGSLHNVQPPTETIQASHHWWSS